MDTGLLQAVVPCHRENYHHGMSYHAVGGLIYMYVPIVVFSCDHIVVSLEWFIRKEYLSTILCLIKFNLLFLVSKAQQYF